MGCLLFKTGFKKTGEMIAVIFCRKSKN